MQCKDNFSATGVAIDDSVSIFVSDESEVSLASRDQVSIITPVVLDCMMISLCSNLVYPEHDVY